MNTIEEFDRRARACRACEWSQSRTNVVLRRGTVPDRPEVVFVGEAPGETEDYTGEPFRGRSGVLLDEKLAQFPHSYIITNPVFCRPPGNEFIPVVGEVCRSRHFRHHLDLLEPQRAVVTLGGRARQAMERTFTEVARGSSEFSLNGQRLRVFAMVHPGAMLKPGGIERYRDRWDYGWKTLQRILRVPNPPLAGAP